MNDENLKGLITTIKGSSEYDKYKSEYLEIEKITRKNRKNKKIKQNIQMI